MEDNEPKETASFNQAQFQQSRINECFIRVDTLSVNLFVFKEEVGSWNYEIAFNDLTTILISISPKLTEEEMKEPIQIKDLLKRAVDIPIINTIWSQGYCGKAKPIKTVNPKHQTIIKDLLFKYRLCIEKLMDKKGLSNPNNNNPASEGVHN